MKKYLQITLILGSFGLLVIFRQLRGSETPVIGKQNQNSFGVGQTQTQTQTQTTTPTGSSQNQNQPQTSAMAYKDGTYTGSVEDAFYGNVQVQVIVSGGKISDVNFLQYPNDNQTSQFVNSQAMPLLKQEALQAQSSQVDIVSGASATSQAFQASLTNALNQAKI